MFSVFTTEVSGGFHAHDQDSGLSYFGITADEATERTERVHAVFERLRTEARRERAEREVFK